MIVERPHRRSNTRRAAEVDINPHDSSVNPAVLEQCRYEIRIALETDLSVLLRRNEQVWEFTSRFENELEEHVDRGAQKVLKKLAEGPHSKVTDPTLRRIWEEEVERGRIHF